MNRRTFIAGLSGLVATWPSASQAQDLLNDILTIRTRGSSEPWRWSPSILVIAAQDDHRVQMVRDVVDFWNAELSKLGTPFRLGAVSPVVGSVEVKDFYSSLQENRGNPAALQQFRQIDSDVIVALSNDAFRSITRDWRTPKRKTFVAISRPSPSRPPNAMPNTIAHEFGHVLGLGHSRNQDALMCGDPFQCHYPVPEQGFIPLTKAETTVLGDLYKPYWKPEPPPSPGAD